jgi:hypothetical protein
LLPFFIKEDGGLLAVLIQRNHHGKHLAPVPRINDPQPLRNNTIKTRKCAFLVFPKCVESDMLAIANYVY